MPEVQDIEAPPQIGDNGGGQQPPPKLLLSDEHRRKLDSIVSQMVANKEKDEDIQAVVNDFKQKYAAPPKPTAPAPSTPVAPPQPEHEITHTPLQDIRHVQEMANLPLEMHVVDPQGGLKEATPESVARNKTYQDQFSKMATDLGTQWNAKPEVVKQVLQDFPDEQDETKLQKNATLAVENPVSYSRLKNGDDIRMKIAKDGPAGIHDANIFNHLLDAQDYQQLTEENIPYQMQLMREHNLSQGDIDKLKDTQRSLINSMDAGLLGKYWNSKDKEYGLTPDEYAGLETERLFNPNKAQMDEAIIKHSRGIGEDGKPNPLDMSKQSYAYQRGVENVKYNLQQTGRENLARYVAEHKADTDKQAQALSEQYKQSLQFANPAEQNQLIQDFNNHPVIQEANKLQEASEALKYSEAEDYRRYPLNFADQATRAVADAMDHTSGLGKDALKLGGTFLQGAGETADNTMRFIKNTAINLLASDERKALNSAQNIGHQSLTELAAYQPVSYTGKESPILVPQATQRAVQDILSGPGSDADKQQRAISYIRDNFDQLTVNPKAGQQNLTGKAALFQAANVMGQIAGVANQSFLLGGAIGDASKLQQMVTAFTPMFASTQNQMYEQAVKNGEEHPLLKSTVDATILSLASLINPDIKVVKGMVGAETGLGKTIAGITEDTWNKVLSENKLVLDRLSGFAKATGRQLGLANLQYGIIAPVAQGIANKAILNEDANIPDMIKDGIIQTNISMALPALLHGVWGGLRATEVNPHQKYSIVEAGLHPDQNIDLIEDKIKSGAISEIQGHEMKQLVKHAGEILQNTEMVKTDGTPMNEKEVADVTYNMLRLRVLEGKLKTAAEPVKPLINEKIHEINKDITDLHTSESDKQRNELNQLLHDNLDKIKNKVPEFEQTAKDAIAANTPEDAFRVIADEANKTKKVEGKETSLRSEAEEKYGKPLVEKAIELSKQKPTEKAPSEAVKPKEGDVTDQKAALTIKPTSDKIQPTDQFRTWDLGDMEGKPEDAAAKKHIEGVVEAWDKHPAGETGGETFGAFVQRVIPAFDKSLKEDPNNTTIVTHSSVLKAFKVWDEMGRPDVANLSEEQKKQFADAYNKEETHNGDLETFKGANGDLHVIRHGQTEDNAKNNFRSGNTNLTEQGVQDAHNVGQQLAAKTGGDVPKVISSDLPRAIHTSNIITDKLSDNAIPKSTTGEVGAYPNGNEGAGRPGQSERMGPSQQGQIPPEESGNTQAQPNGGEVPPGKEGQPTAGGGNVISTKNSVADVIRSDNGLPSVEIPKDRSEDESLNAWRDGTRTPQQIVDQLLSGKDIYDKSITPNDEPIMREYIRGLVNRGIELNKLNESLNDKVKAGDENAVADQASIRQQLLNHYDEMARALDAERIGGNIWHKYGMERQIAVNEQGQIVNSINRIKAIYGDDMPPEMQKKLSDLQRRHDELTAKNSKIEDDLKKAQIENDLLKQQLADKKTGKKQNKTDSDFTKERKDILADMKKALSDANKKMYSTIPLAPQLGAIAPHVFKLFTSFAEQGVNKIGDIVTGIHGIVKDVVDGISKDDIIDILAGKYSDKSTLPELQKKRNDLLAQARLMSNISNLEKGISIASKKKGEASPEVEKLKKQLSEAKKKSVNEYANLSAEEIKKQSEAIKKQIEKGDYFKMPTVKRKWENNPEWRKNEQEKTDLKQELRNLEQKAYDSKKNMYMKSLDWMNRWGRRVIFFGANAVYTKLSSAAVIGAFAHRIPETLVGRMNARLYPEIAKNAPIEGNLNASSEATWYKEFLNPKKFAQNIWSQAKTGETPLSKELGRHSNEKHIPIVDLFAADVHVMIKDPVKRATFEAAVKAHLKFFADNSIDGTHPLMLESARQAAYKAAEYEIFQNSTKNASGIKKFFNELEKSGIVNANMPDTWNKVKGNAQYTAASLYHFFVPVNSVPLNIIKRVGLGLRAPAQMIEAMSKNKDVRDGILNMSQEESDLLLRQLKKGQIGLAYWTLGFILGGATLGGLYSRYYPDKERKRGVPKIDEMKFGGLNVPKNVQHNTQFQSMQMGATWSTVYDHFIDDKKASQMEALAKASAATAGAATESIPTLEAAARMYEATQTPYGGSKWIKDLKRRVGIGKATSILELMGYDMGDDKKGGSTGGGGAGAYYGK